MGMGDRYRLKAAEFHGKAEAETHARLKQECLAFARSYLLLAEQADRNSDAEIFYAPRVPKLDDLKE